MIENNLNLFDADIFANTRVLLNLRERQQNTIRYQIHNAIRLNLNTQN